MCCSPARLIRWPVRVLVLVLARSGCTAWFDGKGTWVECRLWLSLSLLVA